MKEEYNENKVRIAFSNVKEDIINLKKEIELIKLELFKIKEEMGYKEDNSKGNKGVLITSLQHPNNILITSKHDNIEKLDKNLKDLGQGIKDLILSLTDKEFLVFTLIYQLEEELKRPLTYEEISSKLKMSENHVRVCIHDLISKKIPIIKEKTGLKIYLSIKKEFKSLKIGAKIIDFRRSLTDQTSLSDNFNL
ncbi:hypothetical protein J4446_02085 [Candidatus Woesearchaeota archaeon]|nr:hypothetical protein [Candidatus Woesearchaeota archaeon]